MEMSPANEEYPVMEVQGIDNDEVYYVRFDPNYARALVARTAILASQGL